MTSSCSTADFTVWLHAKLRDLHTDENIFGDYIIGILDDGDTDDDASAADSEKREALQDIISQIVDDANDPDRIAAILDAIVTHWHEHQPKQRPDAKLPPAEKIDIDEQLAKLLEGKTLAASATKAPKAPLSAEEIRIRDQILAQYSQVELDECDPDDDGGPPPAGAAAQASSAPGATTADADPLMEKNTNALDVQLLAKERREQARSDSKAKKDKDKEDR